MAGDHKETVLVQASSAVGLGEGRNSGGERQRADSKDLVISWKWGCRKE